ncbi:hypothetical protein CA13_05930 [Planctomycetes bacterium CA13]|uniref:Uncharacterized protein n=1 Tax=Novipirellula herctigrandis TaxID=2527986 RepID=A0A5C5YW38_9BACT|nr:hypothetical protein CA13_05930 [Planctomycetes bacterium CA13]
MATAILGGSGMPRNEALGTGKASFRKASCPDV